MDWNKFLYNEGEQPLENLVDSYSHTSVFRRIAFVGDSLSSGEFETRNEKAQPSYHDLYEYSWGQYIARSCGLTAFNFSRGGMTAKEFIDSFAEANGMWDKEKACQAYVIALGVNDVYNKGMEIGSVADIDVNDWRNNKPTFLGYYAMIISRYKEISPDAKFFFVTFPKEESRTAQSDKTLGVISALYDLTKVFDNSYVIDLYKYGPVYDKSFKDKFFLYGHMTPAGYILTARLVDSYIDYIVRHNPEDFKTAGFINSGIKYKY
jgi:hypothetical protein